MEKLLLSINNEKPPGIDNLDGKLLRMVADKGVGTGGDGGDVSPPIFETGAFVPPKNYTAKYIYIFFIFYSLLFSKRNTASCHLPHVWQRVGLGAVGSYKVFRLETPSNRCLEE